MKIITKQKVFIISMVAFASFFEVPESKAGEIYRGNFAQNEADKISIEIISESPLKVAYCYVDDCSEFQPTGTLENMTLVMQPNSDFRGAEMTLRKKFGKYSAEYVHKDGRRFFARLVKE